MVLGFPWSAWLVAFTAAAQAAGHMYVIEIRANIRVHHIVTALELILLTAFYLLKDGAGRPAVRPGGEEAEGADHSTERTAE